MNTILKISLLVLLSSSPAFPQTTQIEDPLLDRMAGKWVLEGIIADQKTTHDVVVSWVLGHQYIQLIEVSREKDSDGKPLYEALVYITWEQALNQYKCLWLDNTGNGGLSGQAIGLANRNGDSINFVFKISDGNTFHTSFLYDKNSDSWQWNMDSKENDKILPFARVVLTKVK